MLTRSTADDPVLGRWTLATWRPPSGAPLHGIVERVWDFAGRLALARERVLPDGRVELIVQLDTPHRAVHPDGRTGEPFPVTCVGGLRRAPAVVEAPAGFGRVLGVRLHPAGAHALLALPLHVAVDRTLDLRDCAGPLAAALAERCADARDAEGRVAAAVAWLERRLASARPVDPGIAWTLATLDAAHGVASVTALRERLGWSRTRFAAAFRTHVGVSAKRYARIARFRRAVTLLRERPASLGAVAHGAGYCDQPHFTAEFREMAGLTPGAYRAAVHYPDGVNPAEPSDGDAP